MNLYQLLNKNKEIKIIKLEITRETQKRYFARKMICQTYIEKGRLGMIENNVYENYFVWAEKEQDALESYLNALIKKRESEILNLDEQIKNCKMDICKFHDVLKENKEENKFRENNLNYI